MITRLHVENFKCLREVDVDLGAFTVLIGANDSGKSSILDAIHVLGRTAHTNTVESLTPDEGKSENAFDETVWCHEAERRINLSIEGTSGRQRFSYALGLRRGAAIHSETIKIDDRVLEEVSAVASTPPLTWFNWTTKHNAPTDGSLLQLVPGFASTTKYRFDPRALRRVAPLRATPRLTPSGDNLPEAVDAIFTGSDRMAIQRLESALHAAVPTLSGIALRTVRFDSNTIGKELEFILAGTDPPVTVPTTQASEGALLLTAYLTLAYGDTPEILLIEEPENGLHPTRLETVIDLLRKISTGAVGNRPRQVIMTTHSPLLLNYIKPEEVRIVRRDPEDGTEVTPMTAVPDLDRLLGEFAVGELWYLLTEEGLLKGQQP